MFEAGCRNGLHLGRSLSIFLVCLAFPSASDAQVPQLGDVQRLQVITIAMQVGNTEKESKQVTYTPPPGWYVRSHGVEGIKKYGHASFSINTVPQNWGWFSEEKIEESYQYLIDLAAKANNAGLQSKFLLERDAMLMELRKVRSTHHALVVDATVKGEGFLRSGAGLQLIVSAELVYIGTEDALARTIAGHKKALEE